MPECLLGFWAGPAAQMKYQPESVRAVHFESDLYKIRRCVDVITRWSPGRKGGLISGIKRRATAAMNDPDIWRQVDALARTLAKELELTGDQVEAIILSADPQARARRPGSRRRDAGIVPKPWIPAPSESSCAMSPTSG